MLNLLIVLTAIILLTVLLHYENSQNIKGLLPAKTLLSSLFVLAVLVQPHPITHYYRFLLTGFLLCLVG
ncbi:MAG: lysoplasmalogenase, partial [Desulfobacteraceae bacterium]|nr:lysoplasmalogenase [Desulfobacteraceae bacterium]